MSIVTGNIIKYDSTIVDENRIDEYKDDYYKPYFVEFISDYFDLDYLESLRIQFQAEQWIEIQFLEDEVDEEYISGVFIFSASPLKIGERLIKIINIDVPENVKNFNELYLKKVKKCMFDTQKKDFLDNELKKIFPREYNKCEITIFNVGQGSFNLIEIDNKKFIFDIGDSKYDGESIEKKNKKEADNLIKAINPDCIILSHWDLDHILGITKMTDKIFEAYWIVPDITGKRGFSDSAKRLICFLACCNRTKLISICSEKENWNNKIIFSNDIFELGKGTGDSSKTSLYLCGKINGLNFQNNFGLVLKVKGKKEHAIFAGDCEYKAFPKNFMTQYPNYLVVPHHGSKMDFDIENIENIENNKLKVNRKIAFIPSGKNNYKCKYSSKVTDCYSHPHDCHIRFLEENGYSVYKTTLTSYYTFKL